MMSGFTPNAFTGPFLFVEAFAFASFCWGKFSPLPALVASLASLNRSWWLHAVSSRCFFEAGIGSLITKRTLRRATPPSQATDRIRTGIAGFTRTHNLRSAENTC